MGVTSIQWTDRSANPIRARHKVTGKVGWHCVMPSPGCAHCYSHALNGRFGTGLPYNKRSEDEIELFLDLKSMEALRRRREPSKVFLCDMTDIFGEFVPFDWIDRIFELIAVSTRHTFQVLTKRPARMAEYFRGGRPALGNVWLGASVEDQRRADERIPELLKIPAAVRFLSVEPLLGSISLTSQALIPATGDHPDMVGYMVGPDDGKSVLHKTRGEALGESGIHWVIVGGESGPHARPCDLAWIRSIRDQCEAAGVAVFIKQLGAVPIGFDGETAVLGTREHAFGNGSWRRLSDPKGGDIDEWPEDLRIREFPR